MKKITIRYQKKDGAEGEWYKFDGFILSTYPVDEMEMETDLAKTYEHTFYAQSEEAVMDFITDSLPGSNIAVLMHTSTELTASEWDEIQERL